MSKVEVTYRYKCDHLGCTVEYIGETGKTFEDRCKDNLRTPSPIHNHTNTMDNPIKLDNFSIMDRESQGVTRTIKEAMCIRVNNPSLKGNLGKCQLPHLWDEVLQDTLALCLKWYPLHPFSCLTWAPSSTHHGGTHILLVSMILSVLPFTPTRP